MAVCHLTVPTRVLTNSTTAVCTFRLVKCKSKQHPNCKSTATENLELSNNGTKEHFL